MARVEGKTFIATPEKFATVPHTKEGVAGTLGKWMSPDQLNKEMSERFPGCMKGRTMHVLPFSMGPLGSHIAKYAVEITDSAYVTLNMYIMTRVTPKVWHYIKEDKGKFVRALHSVGMPKYVPPLIPLRPSSALVAITHTSVLLTS